MIWSTKVIEKTKHNKVCFLCYERINKGERAVKMVKRIGRPLNSLKNIYCHFDCGIKSTNPLIESAVLQYSHELNEKIKQMQKIVKKIENAE